MSDKPFEQEAGASDAPPKETAVKDTANGVGEAAAEPSTTLEAENAALKDKLLRTLADMENLRRRTEREIADAKSYGIASFARDMLTVADNIQRALEALPREERDKAEAAFKGFVEGIELTERDLLKTLERHGVKRLDPKGEKFDPHRHQAMFEVPDPSVPNGTVLQVVQAGFVIGERVLRPALVGVSKGGPKQAPEGTDKEPVQQ